MSKISPFRHVSIVSQVKENTKTGDSLGNPNTPGYENVWGRLDKKAAAKEVAKSESTSASQEQTSNNVVPLFPSKVRLQLGWDALLFVQKTICQRARGILNVLEAPKRYFKAKNKQVLIKKYQGIILDYDCSREEQKAKEKASEKRIEEKKSINEAA